MCPFRIFIVGCRTSQLAIYCQEPHAWSYNRTWHYIEWVCFTIRLLLLQRWMKMMMMFFGVKPKENCSLFLILVGYLASMLSPMFDVGQCSLCLSGKLVYWLYVECRFVFSLFLGKRKNIGKLFLNIFLFLCFHFGYWNHDKPHSGINKWVTDGSNICVCSMYFEINLLEH